MWVTSDAIHGSAHNTPSYTTYSGVNSFKVEQQKIRQALTPTFVTQPYFCGVEILGKDYKFLKSRWNLPEIRWALPHPLL